MKEIIVSSKKYQNKSFLSIFTLTKLSRNILFYISFHIQKNLKTMLKTDIRKIDFGGKNTLKTHLVNLDTNLDCVILISTKDQRLEELLYNKIIDALIDRIHPKNTYKDFSNALENINAFLSNWKREGEKIKGLHAII